MKKSEVQEAKVVNKVNMKLYQKVKLMILTKSNKFNQELIQVQSSWRNLQKQKMNSKMLL